MKILLLVLIFSSCSFFSRKIVGGQDQTKSGHKEKFYLTDKSGKFIVSAESGLLDKSKFIYKKRVLSEAGEGNTPLEQLISISKKEKIKLKEGGTLQVLSPEISQYSVWFDGKKYFSEMKVDKRGKLSLRYHSPEQGKTGKKEISLPKSTGVRCFFSQVLDCVKATGFLEKSKEKNAGKMHFQLLWDGHPFLQEQYPGLKEIPYSEASFEFDGKNKNKEIRYTLQAAGQSIFYFVDNEASLKKIFWISEGLTMTKIENNKLKNEKNDKEKELEYENDQNDEDE